jgi:methyl coenzyme M reductase gamma subunit
MARREVKPGKRDLWSDLGKVEVEAQRVKDGNSRYEVYLDGEHIGHVDSARITSWRQSPSGIRLGARGRPLQWSCQDVDHPGEPYQRSSGYIFDTRGAAIGSLLRRIKRRREDAEGEA